MPALLSVGTVPAALFFLLFFAFPRCQTLLTLSFVITPLMQSSSWPSSPSQSVSYPLFKTQPYYVSLPSKSIFPLLHLHLIQDVLKTLSRVTISHLLTLLHPQTPIILATLRRRSGFLLYWSQTAKNEFSVERLYIQSPILGQWSWTNIQTRYPSFQDDFSDGEIPIMFFWWICAMKRNFVKIYLTYNELF